jgi:hypothetical protein
VRERHASMKKKQNKAVNSNSPGDMQISILKKTEKKNPTHKKL